MYWTETHTSGTGEHQTTYTVTYQSKETYAHEARILWNSDQSPHGKIGPGTFDLPFQSVLPPNGLHWAPFKGVLDQFPKLSIQDFILVIIYH